jgi:hypothetical protein
MDLWADYDYARECRAWVRQEDAREREDAEQARLERERHTQRDVRLPLTTVRPGR